MTKARGRERSQPCRAWCGRRILLMGGECEFWAGRWIKTAALRTDDGFVDLMSAQLNDFMGIPAERWYR